MFLRSLLDSNALMAIAADTIPLVELLLIIGGKFGDLGEEVDELEEARESDCVAEEEVALTGVAVAAGAA